MTIHQLVRTWLPVEQAIAHLRRELCEDDAVKRVALTALLFAAAVASWRWMRRDRVWEANRKEFDYPENWIEPEPRSDETPSSEKRDYTLLQDEIPPV